MAHLPVVLLRKLLDALDNLLIIVLASRRQGISLLFAFGARGGTECGGRAGEMTTAEGRPLCSVSDGQTKTVDVLGYAPG